MRKRTAILMAMSLILGGCSARSISDSGYPGDRPGRSYDNTPSDYRGEIDDFALLVSDDSASISDQQIAKALADHQPVRAAIGKPLLVVQSGALVPDGAMITALQRHFPVIPFNGQPPEPESGGSLAVRVSTGTAKTAIDQANQAAASYARRLRLAAADGGAAHILVYWGVLETAQRNQPTELISWVPIIGLAVPDQSQMMRIRLKAALIDTASGQWQMLLPLPISDDSLSSALTRRASDQDQVALLKRQGYLALADQLAASAD